MVGNVNLKVLEVMDENGCNLGLWRTLVIAPVVEKILHANVHLREGADKCIWVHTMDGKFTTKSAWNLIRKQGIVCHGGGDSGRFMCWQRCLSYVGGREEKHCLWMR